MEIVTERLLLAVRKQKEKIGADLSEQRVFVKKQRLRCHKCGKLGHIKKFCRNYSGDKRDYKLKQKASAAESKQVESSSDSESAGLVVQHAMTSCLGRAARIIDSGATCHMCNK